MQACKHAHARLCGVMCKPGATHSPCFTSPVEAGGVLRSTQVVERSTHTHTAWPCGGQVKHGECAARQRMALAAPHPPTPCTSAGTMQAYWTHTNRQPGTRHHDPNTQHTKQQQRQQQRVRHLSNEKLLGGHSNQHAVLRPPWEGRTARSGGTHHTKRARAHDSTRQQRQRQQHTSGKT